MTGTTPKHTPMIAQFLAIKAEHPDALLFYRMGEFYELFFDDALTAAPILDIILTSRGKSGGQPIPMAGVPVHRLDSYLKIAVEAGHKVAICEQMEPPGKGKGPVRREVLRVVTSGTLTEESLLNPRSNNFLVAIAPPSKKSGSPALAALDLSTGQFQVGEPGSWELTSASLSGLNPVEVVAPEGWSCPQEIMSWQHRITRRPGWEFDRDQAVERIKKHFNVAVLEGFGIADSPLCQRAAGALIAYCQETQRGALSHITALSRTLSDQFMVLDDNCRRNLEINGALRDGGRKGSLLGVLDETATAMGSRLMTQWLNRPLQQVAEILARQEGVEWLLTGNPLARERIREVLQRVRDLERLLSRIALGRAAPRDFGALRLTLEQLPVLADNLSGDDLPAILRQVKRCLDGHERLLTLLQSVLADNLPVALKEGGVIRVGYHAELDRLRDLSGGGKKGLADLERQEREKTGIPSLKVKYHRTFGYTLEVTNVHKERVPYSYQHKQTMANAIRYTTPELKEFEEQIFDAEERLHLLEAELFDTLSQEVATHAASLQQTAVGLATLDVLATFAQTAEQRDFHRPEVNEESVIHIQQGRHPVVEALLCEEPFVPNDLRLDTHDNRLSLITGPNMAGKSTFMRQVALIVLMAHTGSFVPASKAVVGLTDRIFTRVGAADDLAGGRSTFMVEMTETAHILHHATTRSLVVLDEIGRGTSTFDGLSIAWAVVERIHGVCRSRTLFATHYHELTELARLKPGIVNYTVEVKESSRRILFLRTIVPGAASSSYGIHVAELAGLPREVIRRAREVLSQLEEAEQKKPAPSSAKKASQAEAYVEPTQLSLFMEAPPEPALSELKALDPDDLTPRQALEALYRLKKLL
ncbi:MAG: DNA mismatch repair protein MutS [Magnetococcales bacterium]|nr:DNA mismatch repair protein MutS [Magnetococcales bacterium]